MFVTLSDKLSEAVHAAKAISFSHSPYLESFARGVEHGLVDALVISNNYEVKAFCAGCGQEKICPIKRDEMGGYVCLSCIDAKLNEYFIESQKNVKAI